MEPKELKEYIYSDEDRLTKVLEAAGFHDIWRNSSNEIRCAVPEGTNRTSVAVKLEPDLFTSIYSTSHTYSGDLLGAIQEVRGDGFRDTMLFIHAVLGIANKKEKVEKRHDPLAMLKKLSGGKRKAKRNPKENKKFNRSFLNKYVMLLHKNIIEEGISPKVGKMFDVCYDPELGRIIFPHYDWQEADKIVGIKGRTTLPAEVAEELDVQKYWNYIKGYQKTSNLFGFHLAKNNLENSKMLILFEGEKSVLKEFTYSKGLGCSVALGGHAISEEQVKIIVQNTPMDCEVVIAFDKDVMMNHQKENGDMYIGEDYLKEEAKKFSGLRKVSYIYDKFNLLGEKSAPIDEGLKKWNHLLKWRIAA